MEKQQQQEQETVAQKIARLSLTSRDTQHKTFAEFEAEHIAARNAHFARLAVFVAWPLTLAAITAYLW